MVCCSAFECSNRTDRKSKEPKGTSEPKITFHQFPKDPHLKSEWIQAVNRKEWMPSPRSVLCSIHFMEDCFDRRMVNVRLHKHAVPTIFPAFPSYVQQKEKPERKRKLITTVEEDVQTSMSGISATDFDNLQPSTSAQPPDFADFQVLRPETPVPTVSSTWKHLISPTRSLSPDHSYFSPTISEPRNEFKSQILKYRRKVRALQQIKRRQTKKISAMQNAIKCLQEQNLLLEEDINVLGNISGASKTKLKRGKKKALEEQDASALYSLEEEPRTIQQEPEAIEIDESSEITIKDEFLLTEDLLQQINPQDSISSRISHESTSVKEELIEPEPDTSIIKTEIENSNVAEHTSSSKIEAVLPQHQTLDPVDMMFLDFARRFKTFTSKRQLLVKSRLCQIMAEAELEQMDDRQRHK